MTHPGRIGDWSVEAHLGTGGSGTVYRVRRGDQVCALKLLHRHALTSATRERFRHEFALLSSLSHSRIVPVVDRVEGPEVLAIVSELAGGVTLEAHLSAVAGRGLPLEETISLLSELCEGLDFLHGHGILHRDLKPANVMIGPEGTPRILDFGLARLMGEETIVTDPKRIKMTLAYTAPEIILRGPTGPPTDLYALGHILYQMLTGQAAFAKKSLAALATAHISEPAPRPGALRPLSHWWDEITAKLLAKKALQRYPTARALREDLAALAEELAPT